MRLLLLLLFSMRAAASSAMFGPFERVSVSKNKKWSFNARAEGVRIAILVIVLGQSFDRRSKQ
jgi:hypothetical protein